MNKIILNTEYAFVFGAYWMIYGVTGSFASVFMLAKGYSNVNIGMTLAAANLLAFALQPFVADRMDRVTGIKLVDASARMTLIMMLAGVGYFIFSGGSLILAASIVIILALHAALQPILNSLAFRLCECGTEVSFGIGRAGGSLGYSLLLAVLGTLVEKNGVMALPVYAEMTCIALIACLFLTKSTFIKLKNQADPGGKESSADIQKNSAEKDVERIDLGSFIKRNKYFFIMNLGIVGLFFGNSVMTNYMAQIAGNIGGTTEQVGRILSLMAFLEIPTMVFFGRINKHIKSRSLIKLASLGFIARITTCWAAGSVGILYFSQTFQLCAFGLIMPAMVAYINEIMSPGEAVKGQALFTMMITLATVVASLAGGWLMDAYSVGTLNFVSLLITIAGAVVVILSIGKVKAHK